MSPVKPANTNGGKLKIVLKLRAAKGQLILKCPFGVFKSTNKNRTSALSSKKKSNQKNKDTSLFFGRFEDTKRAF